uniref:GrpE protein homolog n=1 Tax=Populus trichocarpa TaxID=3694 RepID=A0A2K1YHI8_POPTR
MLMTRMLSRLSRSVGQRSLHLCSPSQNHHLLLIPSSQFHEYPNKCITSKVCLFHHSALNSSLFQNFGFTSSASPEPGEKEHGSAVENDGAPTDVKSEETNGSAKLSDPTKVSVSRETKESDAEAVSDLSMDDLVKLVMEKEELLKEKHKEMETMQDKVLRTYAEMENVKERTKREAENSKKFAIQNFAKSLLDVADNLGRASSVVKGNFSKINVSNDAADVVPLLKTLLEGVEMTEKQLGEVGYMLHERVIRPAEVGVTRAVEKDL